MKSRRKSQNLIILFTVFALLLSIGILPAKAVQVTIEPTDVRGVRYINMRLILLSFLAIKPITEDRTVLEFDVSGISGMLQLATVDLWYNDQDLEPSDGIIDVFTFIGDGVVTPDEFYAGGPDPFTSVTAIGEFASIDVTSAVQDARRSRAQFAGFRLSTENGFFFLGSIVLKPEPVMTVVYEPAIEADVDINPDAINLKSNGKRITAFLSLPEGYNVADIDPDSILLEREIEAELVQVDEDRQVIMAAFNRQQIQNILDIGDAYLTINARLTDGTLFQATDTIKVIDKSGGKPTE